MLVAGESDAKVIPLHSNPRRAAASRRAVQRADASRQPGDVPRRRRSQLSDPDERASAEQVAAVIRDIDQQGFAADGRTVVGDTSIELVRRIAGAAEFIRKRMAGGYTVDEFGFDPHINNAIFLPLLRVLFKSWFRVEVSGIENLPQTGPALVVANHAGVLPMDGLMASVAVHDKHSAHRDLRLLAADMVFDIPIVGAAARKAGHTMACTGDTHRLLAAGELTAVFPEGYKGLGKPFQDRYKLQRFGRGGFVSAALRAKAPIVPCSIVGSEEIYPMIADVKLLGRLLGVPYFPITPLFPLAGPLGMIPLPSKWYINFGTPILTTEYDKSAADDPVLTFDLADRIRETIQQTLYQLLAQRRNMFLR